MNNIDYQKLYDTFSDILPENWSRVAVYVRCKNGSQDVGLYVKSAGGNYSSCFELGLDDIDVIKRLSEIGRLVEDSSDYNSNFVLSCVVENTGKFNSSYDYSDAILSETYLNDWEKNYLN